MGTLEPEWNQARPTWADVRDMCRRIRLEPLELPTGPCEKFLKCLRERHSNGGAQLAAFEVGPNPVFDWFVSRNQLTENRLLDWLVLHPAIIESFPDLHISAVPKDVKGFEWFDPFQYEGMLASRLYRGGAYWIENGTGRAERELALELCDAMFGLRFAEVTCYLSYDAWSPWFKDIAWDLTAILFDKKIRKLWMLAVTDVD